MDGGGAAAKQVYERQPEMNTQKVQELEEELVVTKRFTAHLMVNINSDEQQVRKYAEAPDITWSDDCECRQNVSAVADLLKKFIITENNTKKSKTKVTSGTNTIVSCKTQTVAKSRRRDCANAEEQETQNGLKDKYRKLSVLVDEYQREIALLKEEKENMLRHQPQNKSSDHMGRRDARESSNCQQSANQYNRPNRRDFRRKRNLPPCLQAPSRDEEYTFVSPDIHEHSRTWNIDQQSRNQGHCTNRNLPPRLQNRNMPPRLQQAPSRNEDDNFVSLEIHEHPRTWNTGQQSTYQGHRPNRNLPPHLQNRK
jgi:hypothetical protein